ncbi:hypothetical protein L540_19055 [Bordetella pseudohinzii]|nr:hypothetical protein L540_19055 [Bordetella pseudohinzii]
MIRRVACEAASLEPGTSTVTKRTLSPLTPPLALTISRASSKPRLTSLPREASGPVSGNTTPILISARAAVAAPNETAANRAPSAAAQLCLNIIVSSARSCGHVFSG